MCEQASHGLGAVYVPMYEKELPKIWQHIIGDAGIKVLFVRNREVYERVQQLIAELPTLQTVIVLSGCGEGSLSALEEIGAQHPLPALAPDGSALGSIIYTSGTTGDPKGVMLSHANLTLSARCAVDAFRLDQTMHVVAVLPWAHVFGQSADLHDYIHCGGGVAFAESWLDEEGYLHITGRFKDEYKLSNGKYVHPEHIENELRALPFVANAMLYGDRRDYNVALIVPNVTGLGAVPALTGREAASAEDAVASEEVRSELAASISAHLRKHFGGYEVPRRYLFVAEDFTLENGLLTQTLKLKRFNILRKYEAQLQALYES